MCVRSSLEIRRGWNLRAGAMSKVPSVGTTCAFFARCDTRWRARPQAPCMLVQLRHHCGVDRPGSCQVPSAGLPLVAIEFSQNVRHLFLKGKQFLCVFKFQAKACILAFKACLLMSNLAVRWSLVFESEGWVNAQTPSTPGGQVR